MTMKTNKTNLNYGVCVKDTISHGSSGELDYYGVLREIFELYYSEPVNFKCDWYDSTVGKGTHVNKYGLSMFILENVKEYTILLV